MKARKWEYVGSIGVDSGTCMVGDPCYHLHKGSELPEEFARSWSEFCEIGLPEEEALTREIAGCLAITCRTGWGDGLYPVYIQKGEEGRCAAIMIDFMDIPGVEEGA